MIAVLLCHADGRIEVSDLSRLSPIWRKPVRNKTSLAFAPSFVLPTSAATEWEYVEFKLTSNSSNWPIYEEIIREDVA